MELRDYQQNIIDGMRAALKRNKQVLLQLSTGGGKTVITSFMVKGALEKGKTVIFCVHRRELLKQVSNTFTKIGIPHGFIMSGLKFEPDKACYIASIDTLKNRLDKITPPDLLLFDESHHSTSAGWSKIADWASGFIIGMTATPWRTDGKGLKKHFAEMVCGQSMEWLIDNKYLSDYRVIAPTMIDMSGVKESLGEYVTEDLEKLLNDNTLFGAVVDNWIKYANGKRTIAFCPSVKISENLVWQFKERGIAAAHLDALSGKEDRVGQIDAFAAGDVTILSNVGLFTEGFDMSAMVGREVPIEAVIVYRPTLSLSLHLQMLGRALRPKDYPAIILDHGGNCLRHGLPDDDYGWSLEDRPKRKKGEEKEPPSKRCPDCYHVMSAACRDCEECGHVFEAPEKAEVVLEMTELDKNNYRRKKRMEVAKAKSLEELQAIGESRGYKKGWAFVVWEQRKNR